MTNKQELIDALNEDLAKELGTIVRYNDQAARLKGLEGHELRELLIIEISDEVEHARYLADKISTLGGTPTTDPFDFERKDGYKAMIKYNVKVEKADSQAYAKHAEMAGEFGDYDLKVTLEDMAGDERRHAEEMERLL